MATWRGYTRLMKSKKQLRDLELQKEKSAAKVGQFLLNLKTLKRQLHVENIGQTIIKPKPEMVETQEEVRSPISNALLPVLTLATPPSSVDR